MKRMAEQRGNRESSHECNYRREKAICRELSKMWETSIPVGMMSRRSGVRCESVEGNKRAEGRDLPDGRSSALAGTIEKG